MDFIWNIVWLLISTSVTIAQYRVDLSLQNSSVKAGGEFSAVCDVTNEARKTFFIIWVKRFDDGTNHEVEIEIATNSHVNEVFNKTGRYRATYELLTPDYTRVKFLLIISDVQPEDSGQYTCRMSLNSNKEKETFKPFHVYVPVNKVWWSSKDPVTNKDIIYANNQKVSLKEGEIRNFTCHIDGAYPNPKVQVLLGNDDVISKMNFNVSSELHKGDGPKGFQRMTYNSVAFNDAVNVSYSMHDQKLRCTGRTPESDEEKSASLDVILTEYAPQFRCPEKVFAKLHATNYNLSCIVLASPGLEETKFNLGDNDEDNDTMEAGEKNAEYTAETQIISDESSVDEKTKMVLTIFRVSRKHFRKYFFEAENSIRRVTHVIELVQDNHHTYSGITTNSSCGRTSFGFLFALCAAVLASSLI